MSVVVLLAGSKVKQSETTGKSDRGLSDNKSGKSGLGNRRFLMNDANKKGLSLFTMHTYPYQKLLQTIDLQELLIKETDYWTGTL